MRWLKLPEFQAAYWEARRAAYCQAVAKLQQGTTAAATIRLHADLQDSGVCCWFAPHDIRAGQKIHEQIDEAIRV